MRNEYKGTCYRCGCEVEPGKGHFERHKGGWRVQHASCAIIFRGTAHRKRIAPPPKEIDYDKS
jgi:hypothetical protein